MSYFSLFFCVFTVVCFVTLFEGVRAQPTTPYFPQVFAGKCLQKYSDKNGGDTCNKLWGTFSSAAMMDMSMVTDKEFQPFYDSADFSTLPDNALFWSGSKDFANRLATDGTYFTTLEETNTGYILNGMSWCGSQFVPNVPPSFDYEDSCDFVQNATYYGAQGVWKKCSQYFAAGVSGNITILLQPQPYVYGGGPYLAYRNTSIFAQIELPNINPAKVTAIRLLVITDTTNAPQEKCGSGSVNQLYADIVKKFNKVPECVDNPADVLAVLCLHQDDNSPECVVASSCTDNNSSDSTDINRGLLMWAVMGSGTAAFLALIVVVLTVNVLHLRRGYATMYAFE